MNGWSDQIAIAVAAGEGVVLVVLLVWIMALTSKLGKLNRAHQKLMGETGVANLEDAMGALHDRMSQVGARQSEQQERLDHQERRLTTMKGRIGVHRFNAFSDSGSDLSFSVAFVNDEQDGVVITGIHGREQTFLYAKPIDKGQSAYMLTPEEKIAISQASHKG
ncbi:DUF4446 family protein [Cohnella faecalis]|uniref:DUF4446 family protein n=1 Tax=Cohnella faecalis TaxID=2315694 RepID=A0A398CHH7_9BACL|nr:DUF4446 family protein [Cohnella faecalis]RIE01442.1 DUF4446 family protein [Cohnella faecalis]